MKHQLLKLTTILALGLAAIAVTPSQAAQASEQTLKNLNTAFEGESNAANRYALFAKKADDARAAIRTLEFAVAAEKEHAKLYAEALANLGKNAPANYFVCNVCGMTLTELPAKKCPSCRRSKDEYRQIL